MELSGIMSMKVRGKQGREQFYEAQVDTFVVTVWQREKSQRGGIAGALISVTSVSQPWDMVGGQYLHLVPHTLL